MYIEFTSCIHDLTRCIKSFLNASLLKSRISIVTEQEKAAWMKLCERVTETCHVFCDVTGQRAGLFNETEILPDWRFSGMVLNALGQTTVSELIQAANKLEGECARTDHRQ